MNKWIKSFIFLLFALTTQWVQAQSVAKVGTTEYATLQAAVNAAQDLGGTQTINLISNISGETVTINEVANFKLTIDGQKDASSNYTVDAVIVVDGLRGSTTLSGSPTNGATVTLQNIAFVDGGYITSQTSKKMVINPCHYPHHLTIQDCTYTGKSTSLNYWFMQVTDGPLYGATVKNVTVEHSRLIDANLDLDAVFENIIATNDITSGFNGIRTSGTVLIKNCQVTTAKYAFRDYATNYIGTITLQENSFISTSTGGDEGVIVNRGGEDGTAKINVESGTYLGQVKVLNGKENVLNIYAGTKWSYFVNNYLADDIKDTHIFDYDLILNTPTNLELGNVTYTVREANPVAEVVEKGYQQNTLQGALLIAEEGETVKLLKDVSYGLVDGATNPTYIFKKVTLNGNGKTLTNEWATGLNITGPGPVTINNLTINSLKSRGIQTGYVYHLNGVKYEGNLTGTLTINNCTIKSGSLQTNDGPHRYFGVQIVSPNVTVNLNNSTVLSDVDNPTENYTTGGGEHTGVNLSDDNITVNLTNCEIQGFRNCFGCGTYTSPKNNVVNMTGGKTYGLYVFSHPKDDNTNAQYLTYNFKNVDIQSQYLLEEYGRLKERNKVYLTGTTTLPASGKVIEDESKLCEGMIMMDEATAGVYTGKFETYKVVTTDDEPGYTIAKKTYVAQIGDVKFETLADAVAAVPTDGTKTTITMIANEAVTSGITIAAGKNIVLELNGKVVSYNSAEGTTQALITNRGTLVIQDNTDTALNGTGTGLIGADYTNPDTGEIPGYASNTITNSGTLTVKSGKIINTATGGAACYVIDNNNTSYDAILNIEGGYIYRSRSQAVRMYCNSTTKQNTLNISGGIIEGGYAGFWTHLPGSSSTSKKLATINITGGEVKGGNFSLYDYSYGDSFEAVEYSISGGKFKGNIYSYAVAGGVKPGFITGGIFSEEIWDGWIADGYILVNNPDAATNEEYPYTVVPIPASSLLVFHDSGNYEETFVVPMYTRVAGADIYYKVNSGEAQKYTTPLTISEDTQLEAWIQVGNAKVGESITRNYAIVERPAGPSVEDGYYYIKNEGNSKYVNVAGRKTVTFKTLADAKKAAGTVIRVAANGGAVETLRSQAVDLPGYAKRAMNYVPEMVQLIVNKLHADGGGNILGENGVDAIMTKFNKSFDYNLYLEEANGGLRIYGRTPSMKPVVDFYYENKDKVDAKLPELEGFINNAIDKLKNKLGTAANILPDFSLETVWTNMGGTLTEPVDAESTAQFYEEVLSSEANVWSFAYETAMMYYEPLMASETFQGVVAQLGDYKKYLDKLPQVHPNFKYYIVADGNSVDFISQGNPDIETNNAVWTLEKRTDFTVAFEENNVLVDALGTKYYTTLYTDFAYDMPENAKAYAVTGYNMKDIADLQELTGTIPAQTPVLLMTQDESLSATLTLQTSGGTAPAVNLLKGADWIVNEYTLQTAQLQALFDIVKQKLGDTFYANYLEQYEHLLLLNAGTVNNKYFFGLKEEDCSAVNNLRQLSADANGKLGFWEDYNALPANKAFLIEEPDPVLLPIWPDVNCDGMIGVADLTALVEIVLSDDVHGPDWTYKYYNHTVADINQDGMINITDVTELVTIVLNLDNNN